MQDETGSILKDIYLVCKFLVTKYNVFIFTGEEMTSAIGENCYKTSTETYVSFKEFIHVWWGYKERKQY